MLQAITEHAKGIGAVLTCCTGLAGGYVYMDGPVPATRSYVIAQIGELRTMNERLNGRVIDQQLQLNTVQRNLLRKEKFDRDVEISRDPLSSVRGILEQRRDQIVDELDNIEKEREVLRKERAIK